MLPTAICASCACHLTEEELDRIDGVVANRRKVKRGTTLFRNGDRFYQPRRIRTGFFKTSVASEDGRDQVTSFQMAGEMIGLDGIVTTTILATPLR